MNFTIELPDEPGVALSARARAQGVSLSEVVRESLHLLEQHERGEQAKLEWLNEGAREGFAALDGGDYVSLRSAGDIEEFVRQAGKDAAKAFGTERPGG